MYIDIHTGIVLSLITNLLLENAPGNVLLGKKESGLPKDFAVVVSQLYAIDKKGFVEKTRKVDKQVMTENEYVMKIVLGIE